MVRSEPHLEAILASLLEKNLCTGSTSRALSRTWNN